MKYFARLYQGGQFLMSEDLPFRPMIGEKIVIVNFDRVTKYQVIGLSWHMDGTLELDVTAVL